MQDDGEQATFVGTLLDSGEGFTLCSRCMALWCAAMLQGMTGVDMSPVVQAISEPDTTAAGVTEPTSSAAADDDAADDTEWGDVGLDDPMPDNQPDDAPLGKTKSGVTVGHSRAGRDSDSAPTGGKRHATEPTPQDE